MYPAIENLKFELIDETTTSKTECKVSHEINLESRHCSTLQTEMLIFEKNF